MTFRATAALLGRGIMLALCAFLTLAFPVQEAGPVSALPEGYWENNGRWYVQLRDGRMTCRDGLRKVVLDTAFSVTGSPDGRIRLIPEDTALRYEGEEPYGAVTEMFLLDGEMWVREEYSSVSGVYETVLKPVDHGPFDHILIMDEKLMPELEGLWTETGGGSARLDLCDGRLRVWDEDSGCVWIDEPVHVIVYRWDGEQIPWIVPEDLTETEFPGFTAAEYRDGRLSTEMIVYDAETVLRFVFERQETVEPYLKRTEDPGMLCYKPVIYLYPERTAEVTVALEGIELSCSYPGYGEGWRVTAAPDGTLTDAEGKTYNYLYWEGSGRFEWDLSEGFCVAREDIAAFLEDALARLGLTRREANEMIVYWLPLMQEYPCVLISFQQEAYSEAAPLCITPAPDTLIRVFMVWQGLEEPVQVTPQTLTAPERKGFCAVEWGGEEMPGR